VLVGHFEEKGGAIRPSGIYFGCKGWRRHNLTVLRFLRGDGHVVVRQFFRNQGFRRPGPLIYSKKARTSVPCFVCFEEWVKRREERRAQNIERTQRFSKVPKKRGKARNIKVGREIFEKKREEPEPRTSYGSSDNFSRMHKGKCVMKITRSRIREVFMLCRSASAEPGILCINTLRSSTHGEVSR
jgi:hypothetical protein